VRVVPNLYPALRIEGDHDKRGEGLSDMMRGIGAYEIVVETPRHEEDPASFTREQMGEVILAWRERMIDLLRDTRFQYVLVFKNHGPAAGASLQHAHSQIIALPVTPGRIEMELVGTQRYFEYRGRCIYCDILQQELADARRLVAQNADFVAFTPFASRFPFEVTILPRKHEPFFQTVTPALTPGLSEILIDVLRASSPSRIRHTTTSSTPPCRIAAPRALSLAGRGAAEADRDGRLRGSGFFINPMPPEEAAQALRTWRVMDVPDGHPLTTRP
jgi:UDPglucose--hexose-1-phosphate uridylyltransferase